MWKKVFFSVGSILLLAIGSLPFFMSCSSIVDNNSYSDNKSDNANNDNTSDNKNLKDNIDDNEKSNVVIENKESELISDVVKRVDSKYKLENIYLNSFKLFFRAAITKNYSELSGNNIEQIKNTLFPNGNWFSENKNTYTIYEAGDFNDVNLFKKFFRHEQPLINKDSINLDLDDINYQNITNKNLKSFFEIIETKTDIGVQRDISLVIQLANNKKWESNSKNYSIVFSYSQSILNW